VRAPNIGELFGGRGQTFPTGLTDPCVGVTATSSTAASARCRQEAGVQNNIKANTAFTLNQADIQGISGFNGGNPGLTAEKGDTFTVGAVINPTSFHPLRNFVLTVDYFNIRIRNLISAYGRQFILNSCYNNSDPFFCNLVIRRVNQEGPNSPGSIAFVNSLQANLGSFQTTGLDVTVSYRQRLADWGLGSGTLSAKLAYTRVFKYEVPGTGTTNQAGEEGTPWDHASGTIAYADKTWGISLRGNFIGQSYLPATFTTVPADKQTNGANRIKPVFYLNGQVRFTPADKYEFYLGVVNMFDKAPPPILSNLPGDVTGTETDAGTYDPLGRRFYAGVRLKF
jgi:outer membrane receptor protein involved in Fe transport